MALGGSPVGAIGEADVVIPGQAGLAVIRVGQGEEGEADFGRGGGQIGGGHGEDDVTKVHVIWTPFMGD